MPPSDERSTITPDAFTVAPELLGLPLARPSRRALAILVDLFLISFLVQLGGMVLSFVAAAVCFWLARRARRGEVARTTDRRPLRVLGVIFLLVGSLLLGFRLFAGQLAERVIVAAGEGRFGQAGQEIGSALLLPAELAAVQNAATEAEAAAALERVIARMQQLGIPPEGIGERLHELADEAPEERPWVREAALAAAARFPTPTPPPPEPTPAELARAYAAAEEAGDTAAAAAARAQLARVLAADTLREVQARMAELEARLERLEAEQPRERPRRWGGVVEFARATASDLGVGLGWSGLYFTAFLALWRGQTPGKRLLGIRVLRLNGRPITWWAAFERFGGYAAGPATGLLGFLQIYWDRNRQAIHDKISETVVVRDRGHAVLDDSATRTGEHEVG